MRYCPKFSTSGTFFHWNDIKIKTEPKWTHRPPLWVLKMQEIAFWTQILLLLLSKYKHTQLPIPSNTSIQSCKTTSSSILLKTLVILAKQSNLHPKLRIPSPLTHSSPGTHSTAEKNHIKSETEPAWTRRVVRIPRPTAKYSEQDGEKTEKNN